MSVSQTAFEALAVQGGDHVEPDFLMKGSVPIELSGEAVRNRICSFTDRQGREWALRPDLTLPVAQMEVAAREAGDLGETLRHYRGRVFRLPAISGEPVEYEQVGLERFGAPRSGDQDAWLFETLGQVCQSAGIGSAHVSFGDLSIFPAFVDALGLPGDVGAGLKRAFRQEGGVRAYLDGQDRNRSGLAGRVADMSHAEIGAFVEDIFAMTGIRPVGERTADEIVERLAARSKAGPQFEIDEKQKAVLNQVLTLEAPLSDASVSLSEIASDAGLSALSETLDRFRVRADKLAQTTAGLFDSAAMFATRFGRRFTYYDGFVFEIARDDSSDAMMRPFAAGGRYDSLLSDLSGGNVSATAIGGIVIPHRLERIVGASE